MLFITGKGHQRESEVNLGGRSVMSERAKFTRGGRSIMSFLSHTLGFLLEGGCQCARFPSSTNKMWGWVLEIKFPCNWQRIHCQDGATPQITPRVGLLSYRRVGLPHLGIPSDQLLLAASVHLLSATVPHYSLLAWGGANSTALRLPPFAECGARAESLPSLRGCGQDYRPRPC